ncbi:MAG: hypothetical protein SFV21_08530 [Rhodospirillaceae bacterium]|nr:hypothetical protein [Rhodospirillaceae bacterium]
MRTVIGLLATLIAGLAAGPALAQSIALADRKGVQEIVLIVKDLDKATTVYREVGKFVVKSEGAVPTALLAAWGLPAQATAVERVMGVPSTDKGLLRLIRIDGVPQVQMRSSARPFDTGGIFNFNALVRDMDGVFEALRDHGFQGFADPNSYTIFGKKYAGAMLRGHDGVVINLLQRVDQPYDDVPAFDSMSHIINATQMVKNYDQSFKFFTETLGWTVRWEASPNWPPDGSNNMSLPNSLLVAGQVKERAASFRFGDDADGGTIEIFHFDGITGKDFSDRVMPPNFGVMSYRVHVPGLEAYARGLAGKGVAPRVPLATHTIAPYGRVRYMVITAPDGAWLELFEQIGG